MSTPLATPRATGTLAAAIWSLVLVAVTWSQTPAVDVDKGQRRALLIGCTTYDNLRPRDQLGGPGNDARLWKQRLETDYAFRDVRVLVEDAGAQQRPLAAHIVREFERLIADAGAGDRVFLFMAGHGSQQPVDPQDNDPDNFEPDGLDEVFLAADVIGGSIERPVANTITDNQIRRWLTALRAKGASVCAVFDCCHAGSMVRGLDDEQVRSVEAEALSPPEVIAAARAAAEKKQTLGAKRRLQPPLQLPAKEPDLVAIYASGADELTPEGNFPGPDRKPKRHGLFTYTIDRVLTEANKPLTYLELLERVHAHYVAAGRSFPTPQIEGRDKDKTLFREDRAPAKPTLRLSLGEEGWTVDAGEFHGLTEGSVLAVYPPAGGKDEDTSIGHVRIKAGGLGPVSASVEPWAFANVPSPSLRALAEGLRCRVAFVDFGIRPVKLAIDRHVGLDPRADAAPQMLDAAEFAQLSKLLAGIDNNARLFTLAAEGEKPDWLVRRISSKSDDLYLVPAAGLSIDQRDHSAPAAFGPISRDDPAAWLTERLARIQRVVNLQRIAERSTTLDTSEGADLQVEILKLKDRNDRQGDPLATPDLYPGDWLEIRLTNKGREPLDVTVLSVDSGYGIKPFFPYSPGVENRLKPSDKPLRLLARINAKSFGLEHVLIIGVAAKTATRVDFSCLRQETIESARGEALTRGSTKSPLDTALGQLLESAAYGGVRTRGLEAAEINNSSLQLRSWRVRPASE